MDDCFLQLLLLEFLPNDEFLFPFFFWGFLNGGPLSERAVSTTVFARPVKKHSICVVSGSCALFTSRHTDGPADPSQYHG